MSAAVPEAAAGSRAASTLELPPDFDVAWALGFLAARAVPAMEAVRGNEYVRAVARYGAAHVVCMRLEPGGRLRLAALPPLPPDVLQRTARRVLDLGADLEPFRRMAAGDPVLAGLVARRPGLRLPRTPGPFEALVRAVLGQQVSVAAATTLTDRLVRLAAREPDGEGRPAGGLHPFPSPRALAGVSLPALRRLGLTWARAEALRGVARAAADGGLDWERLARVPGEEAQAALVALSGVGPWTAAYTRLRGLGDPDAFPSTDLGVVRALRRLHPDGEGLTKEGIRRMAEAWRPWRGYAALHLWAGGAAERAVTPRLGPPVGGSPRPPPPT